MIFTDNIIGFFSFFCVAKLIACIKFLERIKIKNCVKIAYAISLLVFIVFSNSDFYSQEANLNLSNINLDSTPSSQIKENKSLQDESSENQIMTLAQIDKLIEETEYSKALIQLSKYLDKNPDQLDFVQKRIDKIMFSRGQYMVLANKLLDIMEQEPENAKKKLDIIAELESVEKNPTEQQLQFIKQAKIAAQFTHYRAQFRRITEESSEDVKNAKYSEAISKIQSGFDMYRQEFYEEYPKNITDNVTQIITRITNECKKFDSVQNRLNNAYEEFIKSVQTGNIRDSEDKYNQFDLEMKNLATIRNQIYSNASQLENIFNNLKRQNPELTEASYLPFIFRFTYGVENDSMSGIIGAIDTQYKNYVENSKPYVYSTIVKSDVGLIDKSNVNTISQSELPLQKLSSISGYLNIALELNQMYKNIQSNFNYEVNHQKYVQSMNYASNIISYLNQSYDILKNYQLINKTLSSIERPSDVVEGIRSDDSFASKMIEYSRQYDECAKKADSLLKENWFVSYKNELNLLNNSKESQRNKSVYTPNNILEYDILQNYYSVLNQTLYEVCQAASVKQWTDTASYFATAAKDILSFYESEYKKSDELLSNRFPTEARNLIIQNNKNLTEDTKTLISCRDILLEASENLSSSTKENLSFSKEATEVYNSIEKMNNLKTYSDNTVATCNSEIQLSQRALNEAELRYNQALSSFRRKDYSNARKNLELSSAKYKESFDHQDSESLRIESDNKLLSLGQQINDAENEIIVAEVRKLKNQAKNEYYNGNFEKAEKLLSQAKSRWAITNGEEEDEEIKNLLVLVETALSMKTGRVIPPTAPLYPEMSQILSIAHQYFNDGSKLLKKGKRDEAVNLLNQSKNKLQEIQLVYPLNQEASLLSLKIDQLIDPESFDQMFVQKLNSAKENYKIASRQQTAYTDLLDLYEIRPNYPGLKNLIYQVEIEIGVRQKPVDNSSIIRSQTLTREAQTIVNAAGSNEAQLRNALSKLDQAIVLNPNNDQAILLKDRVQVSLGGRASVVLSSSDEAKYQQAIQELQKNNIVGAYAIVEQLLQKPSNRRSAKILDLQKKVKALL